MIKSGVKGIRTKNPNFVRDAVKQVIENVMEDLEPIVRKNTPIDTGLARRSWRLRGDKLRNQQPYIVRLDEGHSRQSPDGIAEPSFKELNANFKKGKYSNVK